MRVVLQWAVLGLITVVFLGVGHLPHEVYSQENTPTMVPTFTISVMPTFTPQPTATREVILPTEVNGVLLSQFIQISPETQANILRIAQIGDEMGRNPRAFSKLGDSTFEPPFFLTRFDLGPFNLGPYEYLSPILNYYRGSYSRTSMSVVRGLHTWSVLDSMWTPRGGGCIGGENMLECEFRLHNPSLLLIRLGSNDRGNTSALEQNMREIIEFTIENGIIPILSTKADRFDGPNNTNNEIVRALATEYLLPLWDYDLVASTLADRGLVGDQVHYTSFESLDYTRPDAFTRGQGIHNLTALMMLDAVRFALDATN